MKSTALLGTGLRPFALLNIAAHSVSFSYILSRFLLYLIHLYNFFFFVSSPLDLLLHFEVAEKLQIL